MTENNHQLSGMPIFSQGDIIYTEFYFHYRSVQ